MIRNISVKIMPKMNTEQTVFDKSEISENGDHAEKMDINCVKNVDMDNKEHCLR